MENKDKVKRDDGSQAVWITSLMSLCWIAFGILCLNNAGFGWDGFIWWFVVMTIIGFITVLFVPGEEYVRTTGFVIYEYERWNCKQMEYEKLYVYFTETLRAKFIFHKQVSTYTLIPNKDEVVKNINDMQHNSYNSWYGYKTEEDAMNEIIKDVKRFITKDMTKDMIRIRGIKLSQTYTVDYLKSQIESGKLKEKDAEKEG